MAKAYLIEHGETAEDRLGNVHGREHANDPLDRRGERQAARLGAQLRRRMPSRIYTSPARRAQETARIAGAVAGVPVEVAEELRPLETGSLAGGNQRRAAERLKPYLENPGRQIPGGETVAAWRKLHQQFAAKVAQGARKRGQAPPALVTHSAVVGSLAGGAAAAGKSMAHPPPPAEARLVDVGRGRRQ
ncbi:MAG: histidine phosphatase family protein [Terriglobales bacterium]